MNIIQSQKEYYLTEPYTHLSITSNNRNENIYTPSNLSDQDHYASNQEYKNRTAQCYKQLEQYNK